MKALRIHGYGKDLVLDEIKVPDIGPDEVLVRTSVASFNPLDIKLQSGAMDGYFPLTFPYTLGTDLSGTVQRVGSNVTRWQEGDKIVARVDPTSGGAFAEYVAVPAAHMAAAPTTVSLEDAAGIPTVALTAWKGLFENADLKAGQSVLIHAGAGGVGSFAIQFAHDADAQVIATASGDGIDIARRLGADQVIDYKSEDFTKAISGVDVVLDTLAGETQMGSLKALRPGGMLVATPYPPDEEVAKAHGVQASFVFCQSDGALLQNVVEKIDAKHMTVLVDRTFPLTSFHDAFTHQASGRARGKILVSIS